MARFIPKKLLFFTVFLLIATSGLAVYTYLGRAGISLPKMEITPPSGLGFNLPTLTADTVDVLILGLDGTDQLTDVIMVARLDTQAEQLTLLQLPRDLYVGEVAGETGKLNAVFRRGKDHAQGAAALRRVLIDQMGLAVDYYIAVDMATVRDAVDDLGGIRVDVPKRITYLSGKVIEPGEQLLDGEQAEWLIRTRSSYADGDLGRMRAQVLFLSGVMEAAQQKGTLGLVPLAVKYYDRVYTDMPVDVAMGAIPLLTELEENAMTTLDVPLLTFAMHGEYAVFVAHRTKLGALLHEHFGTDPGRVLTPWGPPEPESTESEDPAADLYEDIFKSPNWALNFTS